MVSKRSAITSLRKFKVKTRVLQEDFFASITVLMKESYDNGLEEEEIEDIVDIIINCNNISSTRFQKMVHCLIPKTTVSVTATTNMLAWIVSNHHTAAIGSLKIALQWIIGLLDCSIIDEETVNMFYHFFYLILQRHTLESYASKLIYLLTKSDDVCRANVYQIQQMQRLMGKQKYFSALLCLFKSLKPEIVAENVQAISVHSAFKGPPLNMSTKLQEAHLRKMAVHGLEISLRRGTMWRSAMLDQKKGKKKLMVDVIPPVDYVRFGSRLMAKEESYSVLEFNTLESLGCYLLSVDIPCNTMSLLATEAGFQILAFGDSEVQSRFSNVLHSTLYDAFIRKREWILPEDRQYLVKQVGALEDYMQQGIPVVSNFLTDYLCLWDGLECLQEILHLVEWVTFTSFYELHLCILDHLKTIFVSSNVTVKCSIISTITRLLVNMFNASRYRRTLKLTDVFLETSKMEDEPGTIMRVIHFTMQIIIIGLSQEEGNYLLLNEAILFYERVAQMEEQTDLPLWTVAPPSVIYSGLFSRNSFFLSSVCRLLVRYKQVMYPKLKRQGYRGHFADKWTRVKSYYADFYNCLCGGVAFDNREKGYIFKDLSQSDIDFLSRLVVANQCFALNNNLALLPHMQIVKGIQEGLFKYFSMEDALDIAEKFCPDVGKACKIFMSTHL